MHIHSIIEKPSDWKVKAETQDMYSIYTDACIYTRTEYEEMALIQIFVHWEPVTIKLLSAKGWGFN